MSIIFKRQNVFKKRSNRASALRSLEVTGHGAPAPFNHIYSYVIVCNVPKIKSLKTKYDFLITCSVQPQDSLQSVNLMMYLYYK